jgi:predicted porin
MKKSLIALAVMAAAGAASAQSSVTLFGIVDASISRYINSDGGTNNTVLSNSGYNSSRLGFRGTEDLGGGLSASFWLEGQLQNDAGWGSSTGGLGGGVAAGYDFRRRSTVSLAGARWGELRLGRDYTPTFWNMTVFDAFGTNGVGSNVGHKAKLGGLLGLAGAADPAYVRANNSVGYFLPPNLGGVYGQAMYAFDEAMGPGSPDTGRYIGARVGYASGPFNVAIAYGRTEGTGAAGSPDVRNWNIAGQWDFGMAKLLAIYDRARYDLTAAGADSRLNTIVVGALVPVGAGEIRASFGQTKLDTAGADPRTRQWAIGYVHNLSKRTALYATLAGLRNKSGGTTGISTSLNNSIGNAVVNGSSKGWDIGVRHSF